MKEKITIHDIPNYLTYLEVNPNLISFIIDNFEQAWNLPHRYYHTVDNHLLPLLNDIKKWCEDYTVDKWDEKALVLTAIFHDWIYDPRDVNSVTLSASLFSNQIHFENPEENPEKIKLYDRVEQMILDTQDHKPTVELSGLFCEFDKKILDSSFPTLLEYEKQIYKEYQFADWISYKKRRIEFLEEQNRINLLPLIEYIKNYKPNVGLYCGSFNPFHIGHKNILDKAEYLFDKIIIAKGKNPEKNINDAEYQASLRSLKTTLPNEIIGYAGLLPSLIESLEESGQIITLIRGIRNGYDLAAENTMMEYIKNIYNIKVIYIPCDKEYEHISSSAIRNLAKYGDNLTDKYLI